MKGETRYGDRHRESAKNNSPEPTRLETRCKINIFFTNLQPPAAADCFLRDSEDVFLLPAFVNPDFYY